MIDRETPLAKIAETDVVVNEYRRFDPILGPHQCIKIFIH